MSPKSKKSSKSLKKQAEEPKETINITESTKLSTSTDLKKLEVD